MKQLFSGLLAFSLVFTGCKSTGSMASIQPKSGNIEMPAKGETLIWNNTVHPAFSVSLTNASATQSCEVYKVTAGGSQKWVNPSLMAGKSLTVTVPANGHLMFKNFNPNVFVIAYQVIE